MMISQLGLSFWSDGGGERRRSDLDPEQFYEAIARCALDIFGVAHSGFKSAMMVNRVLSWYKRVKARLKRDKVTSPTSYRATLRSRSGTSLGVYGSGRELQQGIHHTTY
jgi:hypothetical protein